MPCAARADGKHPRILHATLLAVRPQIFLQTAHSRLDVQRHCGTFHSEGRLVERQRLRLAGAGQRIALEVPKRVALLAEQIGDAQRQFDLKSLDRKSTRLNSSHVKISYAVFCLKKKNKI